MGNADFYMKNTLVKYAGKWVAIYKERVFAASEDLKAVLNKIEKLPSEEVLLAKIPPKNVALVY